MRQPSIIESYQHHLQIEITLFSTYTGPITFFNNELVSIPLSVKGPQIQNVELFINQDN